MLLSCILSAGKINFLSYFICTSITLLIQLVTLIKLVRSGKYIEGIKITVIFMLSNIALILVYVSLDRMTPDSMLWIWIIAISCFIFYAL